MALNVVKIMSDRHLSIVQFSRLSWHIFQWTFQLASNYVICKVRRPPWLPSRKPDFTSIIVNRRLDMVSLSVGPKLKRFFKWMGSIVRTMCIRIFLFRITFPNYSCSWPLFANLTNCDIRCNHNWTRWQLNARRQWLCIAWNLVGNFSQENVAFVLLSSAIYIECVQFTERAKSSEKLTANREESIGNAQPNEEWKWKRSQ